MGGDGGVVEVDETIYGRTASHPKGRQRFPSSQHKNIILSLVERDGALRSFHVEATTIGSLMPVIDRNIGHEAQVDDRLGQQYMNFGNRFARHERVDHSSEEYVRYVDGRPPIHANTVEGYFWPFKRAPASAAKEAPAPLSGGV